jgi:hypothetical protein
MLDEQAARAATELAAHRTQLDAPTADVRLISHPP